MRQSETKGQPVQVDVTNVKIVVIMLAFRIGANGINELFTK